MRSPPAWSWSFLVPLACVAGGLALARPRAPSAPAGQDAPLPAAPAAAVAEEAAGPARATTILILRHAEKDPAGDPKDPGLSDAGLRRAEALAALCARAGVTHCIASEFQRTRATLAPLAKAAGLEVESVPAGKPERLVERVDVLPAGSVVVIAGHSNTVPDLVRRLGGETRGLAGPPGKENLPEDAFDRLYVLTRPAAGGREHVAVTTLELALGER